MAFTGFIGRCLHCQRIVKELLTKRSTYLERSRLKSSLTPMTPFTDSPGLFSIAKIKQFPEVIPLIAVIALGAVLQTSILAHNVLTRDDVRYWSTAAYERDEADILAGRPPKPRKLMTINEKFVWPEELVKAYRGDPDDDDSKDKGKKKK